MLALPVGWGVAHGTGIARFACAGRSQRKALELLALQADPPSGDGGYNVGTGSGAMLDRHCAQCSHCPHHAGEDRHCAQCLHCVRNGSSRTGQAMRARCSCAGRAQREDEQLLALQADPPSGDGGYNVRGQALRAMLALSRIMLDGTGSARSLMLANAMLGRAVVGTSSRITVWRRWLLC